MKITNIRDPQYTALNSSINLTMDIEGLGTGISFTASANDCTSYGRNIYAAAAAGVYGVIAAYSPPPAPTIEQITAQNSNTLNALLQRAASAAFSLQSAVSLGVATDQQIASLSAIQQYAVALLSVDLTAMPATWPQLPDSIPE